MEEEIRRRHVQFVAVLKSQIHLQLLWTPECWGLEQSELCWGSLELSSLTGYHSSASRLLSCMACFCEWVLFMFTINHPTWAFSYCPELWNLDREVVNLHAKWCQRKKKKNSYIHMAIYQVLLDVILRALRTSGLFNGTACFQPTLFPVCYCLKHWNMKYIWTKMERSTNWLYVSCHIWDS